MSRMLLSKMVADREQSARAVSAAFGTHGPVAARLLSELLSEALRPDEAPPDIGLFVTLLQRRLDRATTALTEADQTHSRELGDDGPVRDARDAAKASVLAVVTSIRLALTSRFGQDFGGRLGASGPAPDAPNDVLSWGRKVSDALTNLTLPAVDPQGDDGDEVGTFSKETALRKLGQRLAQLEQALADLAREGREAEATQSKKDKALTAYDQTFTLTAGLLEVLLRFAGETTLADRVRPSIRRPGTTALSDPSPAAPTPTDPAGA
jgi:hypothetical protein